MGRLLIDVGHPAHVHLFNELASVLALKGWDILFTLREKGESKALLIAYKLPLIAYGHSENKPISKIFSVIGKCIDLNKIFKSFQPTLSISHGSFYLSLVSWYNNTPNITLEDTGNMEQILLYLPFTQTILTPNSYHHDHGKKQIRYNSFHEAAYINVVAEKNRRQNHGYKPNVILIRLVDWTATHDIGHHGLSIETILELLKLGDEETEFKILSEKSLPVELKNYELFIAPDQLHEYLLRVKLYIGEGATLASECAIMGIPTIYVNPLKAGVIDEKIDAGLMYHFVTDLEVLKKVKELLNDPNILMKHQNAVADFYRGKIDLTAFLVWFIENYPTSARIMKENPDYQYNFK